MTRVTVVMCSILALGGCGTTLQQPGGDVPGCQVRAGSAGLEAGDNPFVDAAGIGGAATVVGVCPPEFHVLTRTPTGSVVCHGTEQWCTDALAAQPIPVTVDQLRALTREP